MIPQELIEEIKAKNCVPFLGAGVSTEGQYRYHNESLLDYIRRISKYPKRESPLFPDVMQYYCDRLDGGRKNRLIREIINWIEPFSIEGEPHRSITQFHHLFARIPYFRVFVTTNWDFFCERALNVLIPMVEDRDIPFWDEGKRQVLKIHGCITRPQTVVATRKDYELCMSDKSRGAIFNKLRDLMATKTFIFAGYSLGDPDFRLMYDEVIENLGDFYRTSYVIDPKPSQQAIQDWEKRGVRIIKMSGIAFARDLTEYFMRIKSIPTDEFLSHLEQQSRRIIKVHFETVKNQDTAGGFASSMYQDGVIHSLEEVIVRSLTGESYDDIDARLREYQDILNRYERREQRDTEGKTLTEIAYWGGRVEVLKRFIARNRRDIPPFYNPVRLRPTHKKLYFS